MKGCQELVAQAKRIVAHLMETLSTAYWLLPEAWCTKDTQRAMEILGTSSGWGWPTLLLGGCQYQKGRIIGFRSLTFYRFWRKAFMAGWYLLPCTCFFGWPFF